MDIRTKSVHSCISNLKVAPDCLLAVMMPYSMGVIANNYRSNNENVKIILDIGDPLTHNATKRSSKYIKKGRLIESNLLRSSDHIIVTNKATKEYFKKEFNIENQYLSIVPQGVNIEIFHSKVSKNKIPKEITNIVYAGAFYKHLRNPNLFFEAIRSYQEVFKVDIYGRHQKIFTEGNDHIRFNGSLEQERLAQKYIESDILLFIDNKFGMQTSGKFLNCLL